MKTNYQLRSLACFFSIAVMCFNFSALAQQIYTFNTCGATGSVGPTQLMANAGYSSTNLSGSVTILIPGIQQWTVPVTSVYNIEARGAQGYGPFGGRGATVSADYSLTAGQVIRILVGQKGAPPISPGADQYGGGGASLVKMGNNSVIIIAGGGGGSWASSFNGNSDASATTTAGAGIGGSLNGNAGTGGAGGGNGGAGDGGGGVSFNGSGPAGGQGLTSGGTGGAITGHGGFGGGGGSASSTNRTAGGGGGFNGGGGSDGGTNGFPQGGGGSSFFSPMSLNQIKITGNNLGDGAVVIRDVCFNLQMAPVTASNLICSGKSATLSAAPGGNYSWSTNTNGISITVSPSVATTYTATGTNSLGCGSSRTIQVNVFTPTFSVTTPVYSCGGDPVTLKASGAISYTWSNGSPSSQIFVYPAGGLTYTVSGTSSSLGIACVTTKTVQVYVNVKPTVFINPINPVLCAGQTTTLVANGAATYSWSTGDTTVFHIVTSTIPITISVNVTGYSHPTCKGNTIASLVTFNECTDVSLKENASGMPQLFVFPNPATSLITIHTADFDGQIEIFNGLGEKIFNVNNSGDPIEISHLPKGLYLVSLIENGTIVTRKKILKE